MSMLMEFIRFGGIGVPVNLLFGTLLIVLLFVGYILAFVFGREKPDGVVLKIWGHLTVGTGFMTALVGFVGTMLGMIKIYTYMESVTLVGDSEFADYSSIMAQGMFEVSFNFLLGFFLAFLAVFGYLSVRLIARRGNV